EVCARGLEQVETIALGLGKRLLVAKDYFCGVVIEASERDEATALQDFAGTARNLKALRIGEDRRIVVGLENALVAPLTKVSRRACVDVVHARLIKEFRQPEDNAHEVVGASSVVDLLHRGRDLVVRLGDDVFDANSGGIVARGVE